MDDSKSSSEESMDKRQVEQVLLNNDEGTGGRLYECVFCKRGFTTAQALGGHMNIHRKDRAKITRKITRAAASTTVPTSVSRTMEYVGPAGFNHYNTAHHHHELNYHMYFPPSTSRPCTASTTTYDPYYSPYHSPVYHVNDDLNAQRGRSLSRFDDDWYCTGLSLKVGPSSHIGIDKREEELVPGQEDDDELDLELRLGLA